MQVLRDMEDVKQLAEILHRVPNVSKFGSKEEPQSWTLAYTFRELEISFRRFLDELLPQLLEEDRSAEELRPILNDIGEELRHIMYHVYDTEYYSFLRTMAGPTDD